MATIPSVDSQDLYGLLISLAVGLLLVKISKFVYHRLNRHKTFERMQVPGPKPNFIHGHLYNTRREPYVRYAQKLHEQYGKTVGIYLGEDPFLLTKDLDLIQQVFVAKSRIFYDRMPFYLNVDPVPDNLICQRGDRWRYMRRLLTPAFSTSKIRSSCFYRDTQATVQKFIKQLEANAKLESNNKPTTYVEDSYDRMAAIALDVIVKIAFHMDNVISFSSPTATPAAPAKGKQQLSQSGAQVDVFLDTVKRACRLAFNPLVELIFCFPFLDKPLTLLCNQLYFGRIIRLLFERLDHLVRKSEKLQLPAKQGEQQQQQQLGEQQQQQRRRIIDSLIEVLRARKITRSEFTGNAFVIVFAGFETTANALTFTLWLLAKHRRVQEKLRTQLEQQVLGVGSSSSPVANRLELTDNQLNELATGCHYLEMVLNESLRLYPPVPALSCRQASTGCTLNNGLRIERGVNVIPSVFSIHRDPAIWGQNSDSFWPERFEMLDVTQLNSAMFMPFGLGPRNCIGKAVAMHEMKIVIGQLVLNYAIQDWTLKTPEKLRLISPINITMTSADKIGLKFVKLQ